MAEDPPRWDVTPEGVNQMLADADFGTGNSCVEVGPTHAVARFVVPAGTRRPGGYVSGPAQFAIADAALWYLVFGVVQRVEPMALTSELSIRFLRPAQGSTLWARASLESAGRRSIVGSVRVWCDEADDRPTSVAQGTYVLPRT